MKSPAANVQDPRKLSRELHAAARHLEQLSQDVGRSLESGPEPAGLAEVREIAELQADELNQLRSKVEELETERQQQSEKVVEFERQRNRLAALYVATAQLHASLDPDDVLASITEVTADLLGAQEVYLLLKGEDGTCEVALARGQTEGHPPFDGLEDSLYVGGEAEIDETLEDGALRKSDSAAWMAVVGLRIESGVIGALVVATLLSHKETLEPEDSELLELLGEHAASALVAARAYSSVERKAQTFENMMKLVGGAS